MHFVRSAFVALVTLTSLAFAQSGSQGPNYFTMTAFSATAGEPAKLTWKPTTDGPVSLSYHTGPGPYTDPGTVIKSGIQNSGSYTWNVPKDLVQGSQYVIVITDANDASIINYSHSFTLDSDYTAAPSTSTLGTTSSTSVDSTSRTATMTTTTGSSASSGSTSSTGSQSSRTSTSSSSSAPSSIGAAMMTGTITTTTGSAAQATRGVGALAAVAIGALML